MRVRLTTYSTKPRGGVVHTLALAEGLARAGHEVAVWALSPRGSGPPGGDVGFFRAVDPRVAVRLVPVGETEGESVGARILRSIDLLTAALAAADAVDVRHAQDCLTANAEGAAHGYDDLLRTVHHLDDFTTPELAACHERALVRPAALVCVSGAVAAEVRAGWGRPSTVIGNGVDAARFAAAAAADDDGGGGDGAGWRARLGRYVLAVGGIEPRKGTLDLVRAMAALRSEHGLDVPLLVAGGDTLFDYRGYRAEVFAEAERLGVAPVVLGPVAQDELPGLVAGAAAFAFPSTKEGFGLAAMEALAAGVPLVVRDLPVLREVFGPAALLADGPEVPASLPAALADALSRPDPERTATGRTLAASHSWDTAARAHAELYARFLAR